MPKRQGSDEAPTLAYARVGARQCLQVPHMHGLTERSAQIPATSLDSLTEHAFCSVIYAMLVSPDGHRAAQLGLRGPAQPGHPRKKIR